MDEVKYALMILVGGFLIGTLFYGGLWLTVKKVTTSKILALWFVGSFFIRVSVLLIGFYYLSSGSCRNLLVCLFGFLIARITITYFIGSSKENKNEFQEEVYHET